MISIRLTLSAFSLYAALALLTAIPTADAGNQLALTTEQIIRQAEAQFNGRVTSVSQADKSQTYQVRLLTRAGKVLIITVDANTGNMHETNAVELKTQSEAVFRPVQNRPKRSSPL